MIQSNSGILPGDTRSHNLQLRTIVNAKRGFRKPGDMAMEVSVGKVLWKRGQIVTKLGGSVHALRPLIELEASRRDLTNSALMNRLNWLKKRDDILSNFGGKQSLFLIMTSSFIFMSHAQRQVYPRRYYYGGTCINNTSVHGLIS
jgi:hypothetical protein